MPPPLPPSPLYFLGLDNGHDYKFLIRCRFSWEWELIHSFNFLYCFCSKHPQDTFTEKPRELIIIYFSFSFIVNRTHHSINMIVTRNYVYSPVNKTSPLPPTWRKIYIYYIFFENINFHTICLTTNKLYSRSC